ncbi:uncharacterized protein BHQ10_009016 [Talaromyces amestolkiae]|uniref:Deoxyribonuclease NucA/NucB domain-containing protein n=1 Tax=Talaromyces amestolkiae TaxID=1196081 RepID=A0A364LB14_TALAM|nr:uncharacterized protein BHQ10_009016 [Talaromyces amestolkiae]RAO73004.1 hypothetical protein BHQ10_009016 [Talaromyces amestolkiae]
MTEGLTFSKRSSRANPIDATFDITLWPNIAEENCFAMLCLQNGNRVYQRVSTSSAADDNRRDSGADFRPFRAAQLASRHTSQINPTTVSAEEFPWASTRQGGATAYVFPATVAEQSRLHGAQGTAINSGYVRSGVGFDDYFRITFTPANLFGQYCTALHANPPDTSICGREPTQTLFGTTGINIANFAYQVVRSGAVPFAFMHVAGANNGKITKRQQDFDVAGILEAAEDIKN